MAQAVQARLEPHPEVDRRPAADVPRAVPANAGATRVSLTVHGDLSSLEQEWRRFEQHADCTAFQTFDWLSTWQRCIGARTGVRPAIVVGRDAAANILFIMPFASKPTGLAHELVWLGGDLCDYSGPLLAPTFSEQVDADQFAVLWKHIRQVIQSHPGLHYDLIRLEQMPAQMGAQPNPLAQLGVTANPSGAYSTRLGDDWEAFYASKRSSSTRSRDRTKRRRLGEAGEVKLVNAVDTDDILGTLDTLMAQKERTFAKMGVANLFAKPGHAEFYRTLATDPASRHLTHVSRLDVGTETAAANLGLTFRGTYYYLLLSYTDGELSRFGPGAAHLHELMRQAIERGFGIFDFTIGDERYKRDWSDTELTLYDHISAATLRGSVVAMSLACKQWLKRLIKQTPSLWSAFGKVRSLAGSLMRRS